LLVYASERRPGIWKGEQDGVTPLRIKDTKAAMNDAIIKIACGLS